MKAINHECYISLEVAKLLKEAGFDWDVNTCYYYSSPDKVSSNGALTSNFNGYAFQHIAVSAPTLDVAQRWLRETQKYHVEVSYAEEKGYLPIYFLYKTNITQNFVFYPTYEEALEAGIKKALEIILERGE